MLRRQLKPLYENVKVLIGVLILLFLLIIVGLTLLTSPHTYAWGTVCTIGGVVLMLCLINGAANYKMLQNFDRITNVRR